MNRQRILAILVIILAVYGLVVYWPLITGMLAPKKAGPAVAAPAIRPGTASTDPTAAKAESDKLEIPPAVDPFARRVAVYTKADIAEQAAKAALHPGTAPVGPKLEGIWVDSGRRVAFISGQTVGPGEKIMGWTVTSILRDQVVLQRGSESKILKMEEK